MERDDRQGEAARVAERRARAQRRIDSYLPPLRPAESSQGAAEPAQAATTALLPYTVEPVAGGCAVIRVRFGGEPGVKLRRKGEA